MVYLSLCLSLFPSSVQKGFDIRTAVVRAVAAASYVYCHHAPTLFLSRYSNHTARHVFNSSSRLPATMSFEFRAGRTISRPSPNPDSPAHNAYIRHFCDWDPLQVAFRVLPSRGKKGDDCINLIIRELESLKRHVQERKRERKDLFLT